MTRINKQLEVALDTICHQGCTYVRECIVKLQKNKPVVETKTIKKEQQKLILDELILIMNIYDMQPNYTKDDLSKAK